jgi:hypothetical protein
MFERSDLRVSQPENKLRWRALGDVRFYSAPWARDGATNQATTRVAKLMKAAAIMSWLLRLNQRDPVPFTDWKSMEGAGGDQ